MGGTEDVQCCPTISSQSMAGCGVDSTSPPKPGGHVVRRTSIVSNMAIIVTAHCISSLTTDEHGPENLDPLAGCHQVISLGPFGNCHTKYITHVAFSSCKKPMGGGDDATPAPTSLRVLVLVGFSRLESTTSSSISIVSGSSDRSPPRAHLSWTRTLMPV